MAYESFLASQAFIKRPGVLSFLVSCLLHLVIFVCILGLGQKKAGMPHCFSPRHNIHFNSTHHDAGATPNQVQMSILTNLIKHKPWAHKRTAHELLPIEKPQFQKQRPMPVATLYTLPTDLILIFRKLGFIVPKIQQPIFKKYAPKREEPQVRHEKKNNQTHAKITPSLPKKKRKKSKPKLHPTTPHTRKTEKKTRPLASQKVSRTPEGHKPDLQKPDPNTSDLVAKKDIESVEFKSVQDASIKEPSRKEPEPTVTQKNIVPEPAPPKIALQTPPPQQTLSRKKTKTPLDEPRETDLAHTIKKVFSESAYAAIAQKKRGPQEETSEGSAENNKELSEMSASAHNLRAIESAHIKYENMGNMGDDAALGDEHGFADQGGLPSGIVINSDQQECAKSDTHTTYQDAAMQRRVYAAIIAKWKPPVGCSDAGPVTIEISISATGKCCAKIIKKSRIPAKDFRAQQAALALAELEEVRGNTLRVTFE